MENKTALSLEHINFAFGTTSVIKDFSLSVESGSFTSLFGRSGCGKTTLLRIFAVFLEPASGTIKIDGIDKTKTGVERRKIGMVFQDYALFPNMTVEQNLLYGLKIISKNKDENAALVQQTAKMLSISALLKRFPHELSGGQQQRVALGRALVLKPRILLMDEPLSSLDTNLRINVREELKEIQNEVGITTIYVTHDQEEAMALSDKIAVMNGGRILQHGTAEKLYFEPADNFTAGFLGDANFFNEHGKTYIVRPEWFLLKKADESSKAKSAKEEIRGHIISKSFLGKTIRYRIKAKTEPHKIITADTDALFEEHFTVGEEILLEIKQRYFLQENM